MNLDNSRTWTQFSGNKINATCSIILRCTMGFSFMAN